MLQLDANLIEEEPYNCLAQLKNKMTKVAQQNSNILEILETGFLSPPKAQNERRQWGPVRCHRQTVFFASNHLPVGQKTSLVNFKHKITTSANYTDSIGTGFTSHDKELCLQGKRLKNYFKINKSN